MIVVLSLTFRWRILVQILCQCRSRFLLSTRMAGHRWQWLSPACVFWWFCRLNTTARLQRPPPLYFFQTKQKEEKLTAQRPFFDFINSSQQSTDFVFGQCCKNLKNKRMPALFLGSWTLNSMRGTRSRIWLSNCGPLANGFLWKKKKHEECQKHCQLFHFL